MDRDFKQAGVGLVVFSVSKLGKLYLLKTYEIFGWI